MTPKIRIDVPCYNRKKITELVLHQFNRTKGENDEIRIYNDNSEEYDNAWLSQYGTPKTYEMPPHQDRWRNIHVIRSKAFKEFLYEDFDFLYLTDNDAFHDPHWREELLQCYKETELPCSAYVSSFMYNNYSSYRAQLVNNRFRLMNNTGGGISIFLHKTQVRRICERLGHLDFWDMWDCMTWQYVNNRYVLTQNSYLDHFGKGGLHHQSWDQERAISPTPYLQTVRPAIIDYLENKIERDEVFQKI